MLATVTEREIPADRDPESDRRLLCRSPLPVFRVRNSPPCPDGAGSLACEHYLRQHE
jgi:hypothetical protein